MQVFAQHEVLHSPHGAIIPINVSFFKAHLSTTVKTLVRGAVWRDKTNEITPWLGRLVDNHSTSNYVIFEILLVEQNKTFIFYRECGKCFEKSPLPHSRQQPWVGMSHLSSRFFFNGANILKPTHTQRTVIKVALTLKVKCDVAVDDITLGCCCPRTSPN